MPEFKEDCSLVKEFKLNLVLPLYKNLRMEYQFLAMLKGLIKKVNTSNFSNIIMTA